MFNAKFKIEMTPGGGGQEHSLEEGQEAPRALGTRGGEG